MGVLIQSLHQSLSTNTTDCMSVAQWTSQGVVVGIDTVENVHVHHVQELKRLGKWILVNFGFRQYYKCIVGNRFETSICPISPWFLFMPIFNRFGVGYCRNIFRWLRYNFFFKLHNTVNDVECLVDTRGSGFNLKATSVIGLLFGSFHLSLMRPSDKYRNSDIICSEGTESGRTHQRSETVGQFSEVLEDHKESYVARVLKTTVERSLISLIKSATAKVRLAMSSSGYQLSHGTKHNSIEDVDERKKEENNALDDLVKKAVARKELNKIIRVVNIGREEEEIRDHPLLTIAESTAHYLMRQMDDVEA
ncbi:unnamed protein product [Acanthocheilonema viteae]|uniref:Uncharacterized protein n=1 Tax=Acanthocheilonema viteae TaxID=6277 RepID=A0A498SPN6_ACAVI|nr:unnamed protein product [Acanthocheilonema viteae]